MTSKKISDKERELFQNAMKDVTPLRQKHQKKTRGITIPEIKKNASYQNDRIPYALSLSDVIYEPVESETFLFFSQYPLPKKQSQALKEGALGSFHTLDLHGLTGEEAKIRLTEFLFSAIQKKHRFFLLIHGKGGRDGKPPVLKNLVNHWLRQIPEILAFCSAKPKDGGTGALYVFLKRKRE